LHGEFPLIINSSGAGSAPECCKCRKLELQPEMPGVIPENLKQLELNCSDAALIPENWNYSPEIQALF
jgi:hypothetical protein